MTGRHAAMPEPVDEDLGSLPSGAHRADTDAVTLVPVDPAIDTSAPAEASPAKPTRRRQRDNGQ
jgi:hypothetical protein